MPAFILCSIALLVFAASTMFLSLGYHPATLAALFFSLPIAQQISWLIVCLVPLAFVAAALFQHSRLVEQRRALDILETRLRGVRQEVVGLEEVQKVADQGAQYLVQSDPEQAISTLQGRISHTDQAIQVHQHYNDSGDMLSRIEEMRQQQQELRGKLGEVIAKRRSIETLFAQLQGSQDEMERGLALIAEDKNGETLGERIQKLCQFSAMTDARCEEIEGSMRSLMELGTKFTALESRVAPLNRNDTGVAGVLAALGRVQDRVTASLARLEEDDGVVLAERIRQLTEIKCELDERVSNVLTQFSAIGTIHKDISALFAQLNQAQRIPREVDAGGRVVSMAG
jgi:chromosome segregation ATPase